MFIFDVHNYIYTTSEFTMRNDVPSKAEYDDLIQAYQDQYQLLLDEIENVAPLEETAGTAAATNSDEITAEQGAVVEELVALNEDLQSQTRKMREASVVKVTHSVHAAAKIRRRRVRLNKRIEYLETEQIHLRYLMGTARSVLRDADEQSLIARQSRMKYRMWQIVAVIMVLLTVSALTGNTYVGIGAMVGGAVAMMFFVLPIRGWNLLMLIMVAVCAAAVLLPA